MIITKSIREPQEPQKQQEEYTQKMLIQQYNSTRPVGMNTTHPTRDLLNKKFAGNATVRNEVAENRSLGVHILCLEHLRRVYGLDLTFTPLQELMDALEVFKKDKNIERLLSTLKGLQKAYPDEPSIDDIF